MTLDVFGQVEVSFPVPSDPAFVGVKAYFQSLIEDPGAPGGFAFTPGLEATVCPWRNTPFGEPPEGRFHVLRSRPIIPGRSFRFR